MESAMQEGRQICGLFFFQAEDGIRDLTVTGVQTCALPISAASLPGTFFHGESGCHSHSSPLFSPAIMRPRPAASAPRAVKFVVMNPPSGRPDRKSVV